MVGMVKQSSYTQMHLLQERSHCCLTMMDLLRLRGHKIMGGGGGGGEGGGGGLYSFLCLC